MRPARTPPPEKRKKVGLVAPSKTRLKRLRRFYSLASFIILLLRRFVLPRQSLGIVIGQHKLALSHCPVSPLACAIPRVPSLSTMSKCARLVARRGAQHNLAGRETRHKGDALLLTHAGLEWRETKYESEASLPENEARWTCIGHALASIGISFRVITERHVGEPVRWQNVKAIWENRMAPIPAESDRIAIVKAIDTGKLSRH